MCLRAQVIDNNKRGVGRVRRARGLRNNDVGFGRGQGMHNASKGSETMNEAAGARRRDRGIYNNNGSVGGGR